MKYDAHIQSTPEWSIYKGLSTYLLSHIYNSTGELILYLIFSHVLMKNVK